MAGSISVAAILFAVDRGFASDIGNLFIYLVLVLLAGAVGLAVLEFSASVTWADLRETAVIVQLAGGRGFYRKVVIPYEAVRDVALAGRRVSISWTDTIWDEPQSHTLRVTMDRASEFVESLDARRGIAGRATR
jgi:hypothetical protein